MKLPEIEPIGVQESSSAFGAQDAAMRRAAGTFEQGLTMLGQELVKSQNAKAVASFSSSLNDIENEIASKKTLTTQEVKDALGGNLDALPPEIRSQVTRQGLDLSTGQVREFERDDIPTFAVAGSIFDAKARKALEAAGQHITTGGWRADFQERMIPHLQERKAKVGHEALNEAMDYIQTQDTQSAIDLANAGNFPEARQVVTSSRAMDPAYKEKVTEHIDKIEQVKPVFEALQRNDVGAMATFVGKLNDPKEFSKLSPQERQVFSDRLKAEIKQFQDGVKKETDRVLKVNAEAGWNGIFSKVRAGAPVSYSDIPPPGTVSADEQKQMIEYIDNKRKGVEAKTDLNLYAALTDLARNKPEEFANLPITSLINRLSPTDFKHFVDLQAKPPGAGSFDDFVNTDEAINAKLAAPTEQGGYGFDLKKSKDDADLGAKVGHLKSLVQHELAALGHRASIQERDDIIDRVLKSEVSTTKHWWKADERKVASIGVPPKYVVALRRVSADLGLGLSAEGLKQTYNDFAYYEDGITQAWGPQAGPKKRLTPDLALQVYGYLKANWSAIDSELRRVGRLTGKNEIDNSNRTALAVQGFLSRTR